MDVPSNRLQIASRAPTTALEPQAFDARAPITPPSRWLLLKCLLGVADLACVAGALVASFGFGALLDRYEGRPGEDALLVAAALVILCPLVFIWFGLYRTHVIASRIEEFTRIGRAVGTIALLIVALAFLFRLDIARGWLVMICVFLVAFLTLERKAFREELRKRRRDGHFLQPTLIVGTNAEALTLYTDLRDDPYVGYKVVGFVSDTSSEREYPIDSVPVLGATSELFRLVEELGVTSVVLATTAVDQKTVNRLVRDLTDAGVQVEISSSLSDVAPRRLTIRPAGRFPVMHVEAVRRRGWRAGAKRVLDVVGSAVGLLVSAPVMLVAAIVIKLQSKGPVLFRQERLGKDGALFVVYKLRTMRAGAEHGLNELRASNEASEPLFKIRDDPRITRVGRVLRRYSVDELPQLWNVLRGDMSLVGPRPALPGEADRWDGEANARLRVKPGITGMWQVRARSNSSFEEYVRLDLYYVDNWSLWSDLAIIAKTIPAVLSRRGAY